jgi:hypothetical protein
MSKKDFEDCKKNGGKVVRKKLKGGRFISICYDKEGKSHAGDIGMVKKNEEVKEKKEQASTKATPTAEQLKELAEHFNSKRS